MPTTAVLRKKCNIVRPNLKAEICTGPVSFRCPERSSPLSEFTYRSFVSDGTPGLTLRVTEKMLPAQAHLLPVLDAINRRMTSDEKHRRLHLRIEETAPFDVEFTEVGREAAVARLWRSDFDCLLVMLADAAGGVGEQEFYTISEALQQLAPEEALQPMFDWLTGTVPPMSGMLHTKGNAGNGMDMLAMCVADRFFRRFRTDFKR